MAGKHPGVAAVNETRAISISLVDVHGQTRVVAVDEDAVDPHPAPCVEVDGDQSDLLAGGDPVQRIARAGHRRDAQQLIFSVQESCVRRQW